ncbi:MAG: ABC transporter ATP-binding protein [Bacilli bacterium]|jgi:ATP-binding cassette subfamily B protein|nr:ABC transporter ATP-binding protein [Bacilli bacterium]MDD3121003.1 ABC transporter ATP-binding protein [Bacilli bacterium]MDD4063177.1 ABC transporter ATP-binding protein [Bacilli bacterium]MDD4481817.1 ABC transporter ATP-binding protein [Bacilli bacterium]MDD5182791.1 ABC transporter ATP-binding protein [Bacilli bacterium]
MIFGKHINKYYLKYLWIFLIGIFALFAVDIYQLRIPEIFGSIVDSLEEKLLTREMLSEHMYNMFIILLVMFVGRFLWRITLLGNGARIEARIRDDMFKHSLILSQDYYQQNKTGALMALYTNDLQTIRMSVGFGLIMFFDALVLGSLAFYKMITLDLELALLSTIPLFFIALGGRIIGKYMAKKFEARQKAFADMSEFTLENFSGISVIKAFVKEGKELIAFSKINKNNFDKNMDMVKAGILLQAIISGLISSIMVLIIGYGGYLVFSSTPENLFTVGNLTEFMAYFSSLLWPIMAIAQLINLSAQAKASMRRISKLLDEKPTIIDEECDEVSELKGNIRIQNLYFNYPEKEDVILDNISLDIKKGESIGIIGRTGSGKSTFVDLLLRIYNVDEGMIFYDDHDIRRIPLKVLYDSIAYVPQDNFLFNDTISGNIRFGKKGEISDEEVIKAATLADLSENIDEFKDGYNTLIGERGSTISGGQKQRTSIARALIKDAPILILDDSVSAVDTDTEDKIIKNLKQTRKGKTTILIAHRISTVRKLDKILLFDDGKILGFGTHDELMNNATYAHMVQLQALEDEVMAGGIND